MYVKLRYKSKLTVIFSMPRQVKYDIIYKFLLNLYAKYEYESKQYDRVNSVM